MIQFIYSDGRTHHGNVADPWHTWSYVAGILNADGTFNSVVVTDKAISLRRFHTPPGGRCFVVPDLRMEEPCHWDAVPFMIQRVLDYVAGKVAPKNLCGECNECCTTLYIKTPDFEKPSHQTCKNVRAGGCKKYVVRPEPCRTFKCHWLKSQGGNDQMPPELRPDRCNVIFTDNSQEPDDWSVFECHVSRGKEITAAGWAWINSRQAEGFKARLVTHYVGEGGP